MQLAKPKAYSLRGGAEPGTARDMALECAPVMPANQAAWRSKKTTMECCSGVHNAKRRRMSAWPSGTIRNSAGQHEASARRLESHCITAPNAFGYLFRRASSTHAIGVGRGNEGDNRRRRAQAHKIVASWSAPLKRRCLRGSHAEKCCCRQCALPACTASSGWHHNEHTNS